MNTASNYDYTADLRDDKDVIGFGKHAKLTPLELLNLSPKYIVWAWANTTFWVGSEKIVRAAYKRAGIEFAPRKEPEAIKDTPVGEQARITGFEAACFNSFGCFPFDKRNTYKV